MSKINIIYWSCSGNTEAMAKAMVEGAEAAGGEVKLIQVSGATLEDVKEADVLAFGCPAMGAEELEPAEMRPFMDEANPLLKGRKVAIFGSYEWADGQWMRDWEAEIEGTGAVLIDEGLIAYDYPNEDVLDDCRALGKKLANS